MSGIKEINEFVTVTEVRKIVVQSLAPLVSKLQHQLQRISQQSSQMRKQNQRAKRIQKMQSGIQATLLEFSKSLSEIKANINELNNQDKRLTLQVNLQLEKIREQISKLKRQNHKNSEQITENNQKIQKAVKQIASQKQSVDKSIEKIRENVQQMYSDTLQLTKKNTLQFKNSSEKFSSMIFQIQKQREKFNQATSIISMYQSQRDEIFQKIQEGINKMLDVVTHEQLDNLSFKVEKYHSHANQNFEKVPKYKEIIDIKAMMVKIEEKVKDFSKILELQAEVQSIKRRLDQQKIDKKENHVAIERIINQIQQKISQMKDKNIQQAEGSKKQLQEKIKEVKDQIKLLEQNSKQKFSQTLSKNQQLDNLLVELTNDIPKRQEKLKKDIVDEINQVSNRISKRCEGIQTLGENLQTNLSIFGNKLVKIKSDNDIMEDSLRKQLKDLSKHKIIVQNNFQRVGNILSKLTQTQLITQSMNLFNTVEDLKEKLVYATYNDGIICEIQRLKNGEYVLFYRKRHLNFQQANRAIMQGLVEMVDEIIYNEPFLNWSQHAPSTFFIQNIYHNYSAIIKKSQNRLTKIIPQNLSEKTSQFILQPQQKIIDVNQELQKYNSIEASALQRTISATKNNKETKLNIRHGSTTIETSMIYRTISTARNKRQISKNFKQKSTISVVNNQKKETYFNIRNRKKGDPDLEGKIFASRSGRYSRLSNLV